MPAFHITRSIIINAEPTAVFDVVADFRTWNVWSPWLKIDPSAKVTVTDNPNSVGSVYAWKGELTGQGEIEHVSLKRPELLEEQLRFIKPFPSKSAVSFVIRPTADGTELTWHMRGKLPWFMFMMKRMMEVLIGMDYDRGLRMIKELVEHGTVSSKVEVVGIESVAAFELVGLRDSCPMNDIGPAMNRVLSTVCETMSKHQLPTTGAVVSVYHPTDMRSEKFDFTSGIQLTGVNASTPPAPLIKYAIPAAKVLHLRHVGRYEHLGNAWSGAHQYARYKKIKLAKADAWEIYRNDPATTPPEELITDVYLPLK